ncbi:PPC domain-containing DNA-binding protein [Pseudomonas sp. X10]
MNPHFEERDGVRLFIHGGQPRQPRLLECEVSHGEELRIVLPLACNVAEGLLEALEGRRYRSAVGRILCGGAAHLSYHRMVTTSNIQRPYDYGQPVVLDGYITFISGALTVGRDAAGAPLLHCHAGFIDRDGHQHGGHLVLDRLVVGSEALVIRLCLFDQVAYQVQPDAETHFNLLHPVLQEAS